MSETKFTQGPWRHNTASNLGGQVVGVDPARHNGERAVASVHAVDGSQEEYRANLALISSAPELYEALDNLTGILNDIIANGSLEGTTCEAPAAVGVVNAEVLLRRARGESGSAG